MWTAELVADNLPVPGFMKVLSKMEVTEYGHNQGRVYGGGASSERRGKGWPECPQNAPNCTNLHPYFHKFPGG